MIAHVLIFANALWNLRIDQQMRYGYFVFLTIYLLINSIQTNEVKKEHCLINIESLMSCHLLLNLLHELANMILCEALPSIISFLPTNVINLVINDNEFEILFIT